MNGINQPGQVVLTNGDNTSQSMLHNPIK